MRNTLKKASFLFLTSGVTLLAGCADDGPVTPPITRAPDEPYPATGVTREIDLTIEDVDWEVGPYAIYKATGYDGQVPGPAIEVTAGDHVVIHLKNDTKEPHSIHTHVSSFTSDSDGTGDSLVQPGETGTVEWDTLFAGTFPYHDHATESGMSLGLFGMVIVHAPDEVPANEHLVVLADFDPSNYASLPGVADPETGEFPEGGTYHGGHQYMHTINGKAYEDAIPPFEGAVGDLSRWRVISVGSEMHTWHIHGHRWVGDDGHLTDNIMVAPGTYTTFEFVEDNPGTWPVHCHFPNHMEGGMMAEYIVSE